MRSTPAVLLLAIAILVQACATGRTGGGDDSPRAHTLFDSDWRFRGGDVPDGQRPALGTSDWETLNLPHDFMITGQGTNPRGNAQMEGPFDRNSPAGGGGGYLNGGIGWYRKTFDAPANWRGRRIFIQFDGVYMDSEVWLNGKSLGRRPYGYSSFQYELTDGLNIGGQNVLAVRVNVQQPASRWYSGAGIYRHVWLTVTDPVHIKHWSTFVTTPEITKDSATVKIQTVVRNQDSKPHTVKLSADIWSLMDSMPRPKTTAKDGAFTLAAGAETTRTLTVKVANPQLWSTDDPNRYQASVLVNSDGERVDRMAVPFGIRTVEFKTGEGMFINGQHVPIQGVCNHHDLGPLGAAAYKAGIARQLHILKEMGCNAIRTSHNMPDPQLLDLADEMGFVVMDEAFDEWARSKSRFGYGRFFDEWSERDIRDFVRRDRNHPSVVMWSIGNEIPEQGARNAEAMATRLAGFVRAEDPTRPVTSAMNDPQGALRTGYAKPLDLFGINYHIPDYQRLKDIGKPLYGSETSSNFSTRGEYLLTLRDGQVAIQKEAHNQTTSYDLDAPGWGNTAIAEFKALRDAPWIAGEFVWTGFDYIGEPTPFGWPSRSSYFGIIDLCGFPKDRFYLYQSQWQKEPVCHLVPQSWNWPEDYRGKEIPVWVYTNADSVELFLNGQSLGTKQTADTQDFHLAWQVPYAPGTLRAVAKKGGKVVATDHVATAGAPAKIQLTADRDRLAADGQDLAFVTATVVDAEGNRCPDADQVIQFELTGGGTIAAVGNGDPTNHEPFAATRHKAFHGLCLAVVRAGGTAATMTLRAHSGSLTSDRLTIRSQ